ncbi:hypothetical protein IVA94_38625 [Bradyrhizobium sp. 156]|uniref:Ulp1 family isopeptidase n=1 Tax=Bradyrhizobium sp. 156 TaxID=2782630 RepID=UPI001FFB2F96|nr:Ulp1 family isopeptidase [Bradyrhizobium sp. 156]MCK1326595.1 hypothetical protein [Bradyrhizobium sp. 156]
MLEDWHIQEDYRLVRERLQSEHPDLAAKTRFVDPLVSHLLRDTTDENARRQILQGFDTADFLFIPLNDGLPNPSGGLGNHWSLLLVDRRDHDRPVAYHYDSSSNQYNRGFARRLAERVGADLRDGPISWQSNGYDCGVFVVDGTRMLIGLLALGVLPDHGPLDLKPLVVNRQALQERLTAIAKSC